MHTIVLVWAWWTGMSGIAGILQEIWYTNIVCIDANQSQLTDKLKAQGLNVIIWHGIYKIQLGDVVIYSEATAESPEVLEARALMKANKKVMVILNYFQFLGEISKYFRTIGFTGTNGKSSSTALAIHTAKKLLPDFGLGILWALVPSFDTQSYTIQTSAKQDIKNIFDYIFTGKGLKYDTIKKRSFLVEACEYKRHFLHLDLDYAIITSLELDHTDYYHDMQDYLSAFHTIISKVKHQVFIPAGWDETTLNALYPDNEQKIITIPTQHIDFTHLRGEHNNINGSLVLALLHTLGNQPTSYYLPTLCQFTGLRRRMEFLRNDPDKAKIFTDYGHMASSIQLGYKALKAKFPDHNIYGIFQPHQINRIVTWWDDFVQASKAYDHFLVYDIYAAREDLQQLIKQIPALKDIHTLWALGEQFAQACGGTYSDQFDTIKEIMENTPKDTIIVVYSAGDIDYKLRQYLKI